MGGRRQTTACPTGPSSTGCGRGPRTTQSRVRKGGGAARWRCLSHCLAPRAALEIVYGFLLKPFTPVHALLYQRGARARCPDAAPHSPPHAPPPLRRADPAFMKDVHDKNEYRIFDFDHHGEARTARTRPARASLAFRVGFARAAGHGGAVPGDHAADDRAPVLQVRHVPLRVRRPRRRGKAEGAARRGAVAARVAVHGSLLRV